MRKAFITFFGAVALSLTGAAAQSLNDVDADADGVLSPDEWATAVATKEGAFATLSESGGQPGAQPSAEFVNAQFERLDLNDDKTLTEDEYAAFAAATPSK